MTNANKHGTSEAQTARRASPSPVPIVGAKRRSVSYFTTPVARPARRRFIASILTRAVTVGICCVTARHDKIAAFAGYVASAASHYAIVVFPRRAHPLPATITISKRNRRPSHKGC